MRLSITAFRWTGCCHIEIPRGFRLWPRAGAVHGRTLRRIATACAIVPVPLHPARLRSRGYDQALEPKPKPIARALALPLRGISCSAAKSTSAQSRLHADARQHNLREAFRVATVPEASRTSRCWTMS
ncbi:MAG: hypothetical protein U1F19_08405 [Lysobacterales bacterium]